MKQETFDTGLTNQILDTFCSILEKAGYYCGVYSALPYYFDYFDKDFLINTLFGLLIGTQMNQRYLIRFGNMVLNI
jgi:hypothetical protein